MPSPFAIVSQALNESSPSGRASRSWRDSLRMSLPVDELHGILADLARGKAWMAELPDGRCSVPVLPSSDVRLRAAMFLHESLYGKAVAQTEIQKAELEAKEFEAVRALDDEQLETEALRIIEARRVNRLTAGPVTDAEFTVSERPFDIVATIWAATPSEEQNE